MGLAVTEQRGGRKEGKKSEVKTFIPIFFPVGFLWAAWLQSLLRPSSDSFLSGALVRASSPGPFRLKDGENFPLQLAEGTALSLIVSLFSVHTLENSPFITFSLNCPNKAYTVFLGTVSHVHSIPVPTLNRGSKYYFRGINSIIPKLVNLICFFYTSTFLVLPSHLISHGRVVTLFRFFYTGAVEGQGLEAFGAWVRASWMNLGQIV